MNNIFQKHIIKNIKLWQVIVIVICLIMLLIAWVVLNQQKISKINLSSNSLTVYANEQALYDGVNKVKPGVYKISAKGPYIDYNKYIKVGLFTSKQVVISNTDNNISPESIAKNKLADMGYKSGLIDECKKFDDNWFVCRYNLGSAIPIAMHYEDGDWHIFFKSDYVKNKDAMAYYKQILANTRVQ